MYLSSFFHTLLLGHEASNSAKSVLQNLCVVIMRTKEAHLKQIEGNVTVDSCIFVLDSYFMQDVHEIYSAKASHDIEFGLLAQLVARPPPERKARSSSLLRPIARTFGSV